MNSMRVSTVLMTALLAGFAYGQSLSEIAKKEKERRKKNETKGEEVLVITERELTRGQQPSSTETEDSSPPSTSPSTTTGARPMPPPGSSADESAVEGSTPDTIPPDAPLRDKIALFEQMLAAYRQQVREIDEEIATNTARIEEIQQKLNTIGAGGLPVAPTAPTLDQSVRYEGEAPSLQNEQQELRQKNQGLEARKRRLADELRQKGRRAGIPAGYLRF